MFSLYQEKIFQSDKTGNNLKYLYYRPDKAGKLPLIIYAHGAGSRGTDINNMSLTGPVGEVENGRKIDAVVVAPQCYADTWFDIFETLVDFADTIINNENIDINRVYLCGTSMGAYAAWQLAMSKPEWFAALVPVCGGGMYWSASKLKDIPIWAFHGKLDNVVLPRESEEMVNRVNACGGNAKLTEYDGVAHNSWEKVYAENEMWKWLFEQKRK